LFVCQSNAIQHSSTNALHIPDSLPNKPAERN
jgi:hypothetical protein